MKRRVVKLKTGMTRRRLFSLVFLSILIPIAAILYRQSTASIPLFTSQPVSMAAPNPAPVIIVGAGLAGLCAAYSALESGAASVRLLERNAKPGGNSIKASSGINGAPTRFQDAATYGVDQSFWHDTVRAAGSRLHPSVAEPIRNHREALISTLTNRSASAIDFLVGLGVDLSVVAQLGGHSLSRTHRGAGKTPPGASIVTTLLAKLNAQPDRFQLIPNAEVTKLLLAQDNSSSSTTNNNSPSSDSPPAVIGVEYRHRQPDDPSFSSSSSSSAADPPQNSQTHTLHGPVVFAAGGFAGDAHGLLARHRPDLAGLPSTNDPRPGAHALLTAAGAALVDMESVQLHPTGFVDPADPQKTVKFLAAEALRGEGGILLSRGRRFVDELAARAVVSGSVMVMARAGPGDDEEEEEEEGGEDQGEGGLRQWDVQLLLDPGASEAAAGHVGFYLSRRLLRKVKVRELDEVTRETLREYARVVKGERTDMLSTLGRRAFGHWRLTAEDVDAGEAEVCVGRVTPVVHFTMGGAVFNEKAQILASEIGEEQRPIEGLWGAGEITGGLHGDDRLGGSSLLECVVFGRIAGEQAAEWALKRKS